ncbi:hypothetical protein DPMN_124487 [Dreissena polymorpha]|uniref:Uncharacterized protein n=1 Tax=Dreissena polymorpha TaxID=45954 RepID=A0A9D4JW91_DREPO|nr:hypothetical protein DPMN_124487 [Dreissena polymorpha]
MAYESIEVFGFDGSFATVNCTSTPMKTISAETPLHMSKNMSPSANQRKAITMYGTLVTTKMCLE